MANLFTKESIKARMFKQAKYRWHGPPYPTAD